MIHLSFIFHMHQPYYKNLLTEESLAPWVRLHGVKDYLDMVEILTKYPKIQQTFNLVPSLIEQLEDYVEARVKDTYLGLSFKPAQNLTEEDKEFLRSRFFSINKERVISLFPRYYELYLKNASGQQFNEQDFRDLQVWFNLSWIDPSYRQDIPELKAIVRKARFFSEEDKLLVLQKQLEIIRRILPGYKRFLEEQKIELTVSPFYHPILPLLYNTKIAREANLKTPLPQEGFSYPEDALAQINLANEFFRSRFGRLPEGMWPSEQAVSEHIVPFLIQAGIRWIVVDEGILFKSLKLKRRDTRILYQPHLISCKDGELILVARDRNLSDLLGFVYHSWDPRDAVNDFLGHLKRINQAFKDKDVFVVIAMDGENAWEYYIDDGHPFLNLLYESLSELDFVKVTGVSEFLKTHRPKRQIKRLAAGSWIFSEFGKWIGDFYKNKAWDYLSRARNELKKIQRNPAGINIALAIKQMFICEGSDWFWWYGENQMDFDALFRMHLSNFYQIIGQDVPAYLKRPLYSP